jgi:hypothetical protein
MTLHGKYRYLVHDFIFLSLTVARYLLTLVHDLLVLFVHTFVLCGSLLLAKGCKYLSLYFIVYTSIWIGHIASLQPCAHTFRKCFTGIRNPLTICSRYTG